MGVKGAALTTVLSQLVSGLLNLFWIIKKTDLLKHSTGFHSLSVKHLGYLSKVGFPMGFEYSISALDAVVMQGKMTVPDARTG